MLFSAKRRLNRLGIKKAKANASLSADVPKKPPFICSLTSPNMRDINVNAERLTPDRTSDDFFNASCVSSDIKMSISGNLISSKTSNVSV